MALVLVAVVALSGACAGSGDSGSVPGPGPGSDPTAVPTTTTAVDTTTTVDPATLPQTDERPAASGPSFDDRAQALWSAVVADDPSLALPSFFPLAAYEQVKAIKDPAGDWQRRLVGSFDSDIHELHRRLGADAGTAAFEGLSVPDAMVWVKPGAEYNRLPYWRVYGSELRYTVGGAAHAFPVASLISWRGQWFVVHLNSIR